MADFPEIKTWVVVSEFGPLTWHPDFLQKELGDYLHIAYEAAREANPQATLLYVDDVNELTNQAGYPITKKIIQKLKKDNLVDGVGLEMHLEGITPPAEKRLLEAINSYVVPVYIIELDVNMHNVPGSQESRKQIQAQVFHSVIGACLKSKNCKAILTFCLGDKYSWQETDSDQGGRFGPDSDATLFDDNLEPKPAFFSALKAIYEGLLDKQALN